MEAPHRLELNGQLHQYNEILIVTVVAWPGKSS